MSFLTSLFARVVVFFDRHPAVRYASVYAFFFLACMWMYFGVTTVSSSDDHYFHFRFAQIISQEGFLQSFRHFDAIYFSKMLTGQYTVYYNFLFFLFILPFAKLTPLYLGIKLFAVFAIAFYGTVAYGVFRSLSIKNSFLWVVLMFTITGYSSLIRLFLSRPYVLAPAILILIFISCYKRKYVWAAVLSFVYLFWHSLTFYFPLIIGFAFYFFDYFYTRRHNWKVLLAVFSGVVLAVGVSYILVPGFLQYVWDVVFGIYRETIIGKKVLIPEGGELYPGDFFETVNGNLFLFPLFVTATLYQFAQLIRFWPERGEEPTEEKRQELVFTTTLVMLTVCFFIGTILISRRFGDFFMMFSWVLVAYSLNQMVSFITISATWIRKVFLVSLIGCSVFFFVNTSVVLRDALAGGSAPEEFQHVGEWLANNTKPGDIIFYPNWSWFTQLYYYSPHNRYIMGLEPRFMYVYSEPLYWKWFHISSDGYVCDKEKCPDLADAYKSTTHDKKLLKAWNLLEGNAMANSLLNDFHSQYVVTSEGAQMNEIMDASPRFQQVYGKGEKKRYVIYKVIR